MENRLVMFTKAFPYGKGEAFIEAEIVIASQVYEEIILFCCQVDDLSRKPRKTPSNVIVIPIEGKSRRKLLLKSLKLFGNKKYRLRMLQESKKADGIKKKMFAAYFFIKSLCMLEECEPYFKTYINENNDKDFFYILYSYWFFDTAYAAIMLQERFKLKPTSKVITRAHGYDLYKERNPVLYFPFRRLMLEKLDGVYTCSQQGKLYLQNEYPEYSSKIKCSYLGIANKYDSEQENQDGLFHIVTCSYIVPVKRVNKIAEACKRLEEKGISIRWTCIGDGELKEDLERYCQNNLKKTQIDFKGSCSNKEIMEFYQKEHIDVLLNVSSSEGLPVSIMEAMSFGIPAIATDVGGTSEIVQEGKTGFLLDKDFEMADLCSKILEFVNMEYSEKEEIRKICKSFWEEFFEAEKNYNKFFRDLNIES